MFDSKSPVVKIGGYAIIGFFVAIIIISFGMPDFMSQMGLDKSTVAVVNGEKIHYLDFLRFRDNLAGRIKDVNKKEIQMYILDSMIRYRLQLQQAAKIGIKVSEASIKRHIREMPMFQDEEGRFETRRLNYFLDRYHMNLPDYYAMVREDLTNNAIIQMIRMGTGVTADEVTIQHAINNSSLQIRYCFASNVELKKRYAGRLAVSDSEVDRELKENRAEVKDPKTDRERVRKKLEDRKFEELKKELAVDIDRLYARGASFQETVVMLGGKVSASTPFKVGEPVKSAEGKTGILHTINESPGFINDCLALEIGKSSRVINSFDGLYLYTPMKKQISLAPAPAKEYGVVESGLYNEKVNAVYYSMMTSFIEKSKIAKYMTFD
ncbi:MAG TPA: hypothetical protein ENN21_03655 [Spirochaetes bacterium]|nr:hypothetical protein [Spirochaetota bacterium]